MKLIRQTVNGDLITLYYTDPAVSDTASAAERISRIAASEPFEPRYIALQDPDHRSDEGNTTRQLAGNTPAEEILRVLDVHPADRIYLAGRWEETRIGIGIDLRSREIAVTLPALRAGLAPVIAAPV